MPQRNFGEMKAEQQTLRTRVGQLVDEAREIEIKLEVDGADAGLEERKANVERGKAKASARLQELGDELREDLKRRVESGGGRNLESTEFPEWAQAEPREAARVQAD